MAVELNELRDQIDVVDKQMLELLAQRLALVEKVGEVKSEHGLPIYVPEREAAMLASRRAEAEKLGVPPQLIEDILRRTMRESYASEKDSGFKCLNPELRSVVVQCTSPQMLLIKEPKALECAEGGVCECPRHMVCVGEERYYAWHGCMDERECERVLESTWRFENQTPYSELSLSGY